jgi:2-polyprenyl-3-methyl-5-hydroxy-6-metoxy-1,4-benzoquinol methylase
MCAMTNVSAHASAELQGNLWSAGSWDWSELQEPRHVPLYEEAIRRTGIGPSRSVLDLGCGAGVFCRLAVDAGADVTGIDAAEGLLTIARRRVPEGDFHVGPVESLPYGRSQFDVVTCFNVLQYAADATGALAEARRVAKPAGQVFALVWGREERNRLVALPRALRSLLTAAAVGAPDGSVLSRESALEELVTAAGLTPVDRGYLESTFEYPDTRTLMRAMLSTGPVQLAMRACGEKRVRQAVLQAISPFRVASGGYRIETEWRYVISVA